MTQNLQYYPSKAVRSVRPMLHPGKVKGKACNPSRINPRSYRLNSIIEKMFPSRFLDLRHSTLVSIRQGMSRCVGFELGLGSPSPWPEPDNSV